MSELVPFPFLLPSLPQKIVVVLISKMTIIIMLVRYSFPYFLCSRVPYISYHKDSLFFFPRLITLCFFVSFSSSLFFKLLLLCLFFFYLSSPTHLFPKTKRQCHTLLTTTNDYNNTHFEHHTTYILHALYSSTHYTKHSKIKSSSTCITIQNVPILQSTA